MERKGKTIMDAIYNAVKKALAEKGIDVQSEYNKSAKNLCGVNIPPNKTKSRKHIHKGIMNIMDDVIT